MEMTSILVNLHGEFSVFVVTGIHVNGGDALIQVPSFIIILPFQGGFSPIHKIGQRKPYLSYQFSSLHCKFHIFEFKACFLVVL